MWLAAGLGGLSVVLASLFALSAAIEAGWVGPAVRIGIGLTVGTAAWWGGTIARSRGIQWVGSAVVGASIAGLLGTLYAANVLYDLLSSPVTFVMLAGVSAVAIVSGIRAGNRFDAWLGLIGGLATPALVQATEPRPMVLFAYLGALVTGTVWAAARRGQADLILGATIGFSAMFLGWTANGARPIDQPIALGIVTVLAFVLTAASRTATSPSSRSSAEGAGALLPLLLVPWVGPADPLFVDPISGLTVFQPDEWGPWLAATAMVLALVPARVFSQTPLVQGITGLLPIPILFAFAWGHLDVAEPAWFAVGFGIAAVPLVGLLGAPSTDTIDSHRWAPIVSGGLTMAVALVDTRPAPDIWVALSLATILPGVVLAVVRRRPALLLPALVSSTLPLFVATSYLSTLGAAAVAGPAALAFGLYTTLPLLLSGREAKTTVTAALAGPALFWPLYRAWQETPGTDVVGILPVLMGSVALVGALTLLRQFRANRDSGPLALFVGVALLGVTAAIPLQLRDQWVTVAWALEAAAVALTSRRLNHPLLRWTAVLLTLAVTIRLTVNPWALEYADAGGLVVLNWTLYTWGLPAVSVLVANHALRPLTPDGPARVPDAIRLVLLLCAVAIGFALVNVEVSHAFQDSGPIELGGQGIWQGMVRSLAWAAYGISILAVGTWRDQRVIRMVGFVVVLAAAAKVFLFDLWSLSGFVRVGSIAGLGVTLLVAAFVFERLVLRRTTNTPGEPS